MESRSETLRATDVVHKRQGDGFSVRADNLQIRPCDRIHAISEVSEEARAAAATTRPSAGGVRQPLAAATVLIVACVNIPASGHAGLQTGASIYPSVQNLMLAARALGLGTVLTTLHRRRKAQIHAILGIPDDIESAAIIPLGWPDREYGPNRRPSLERFVMRDRWNG
jgi:nitroreductase